MIIGKDIEFTAKYQSVKIYRNTIKINGWILSINDGLSNNNLYGNLKNYSGVYIFTEGTTPAYIGSSRLRTLSKRISEQLSETHTGGTFRKNYMAKNSCTYIDFLDYLVNKCTLSVYFTKHKEPELILEVENYFNSTNTVLYKG